jgi:hypothetical protein
MRIQVPEQWWGDYLATLGAARVAEREILKLGWNTDGTGFTPWSGLGSTIAKRA